MNDPVPIVKRGAKLVGQVLASKEPMVCASSGWKPLAERFETQIDCGEGSV